MQYSRNCIYLILFCVHFISPHMSTVEIIEADATVELITKRIKRSINTQANQDMHEIDINVSALGITHKLALKSQIKGSVISANFQMKSIYTSKTGETVWEDVTPSSKDITEMEQKIFVDVQTNSVVLVDYYSDDAEDRLSIDGIVNDARIRSKRSPDGKHVIQVFNFTVVPQSPLDKEVKDYIVVKGNNLLQRKTFPTIGPLNAVIELAYVVDYKTTVETFKKDRQKMLEYYAIMTNSINNKFTLSEDPLIKCLMVGLYMIESEEEETFVKAGLDGNTGKYDLDTILHDFSLWAYKNRDKLGPYDVLPLMLGIEFNQEGLRGKSPLGGACQLNINGGSNAIPCSQDIGGIFGGAFTVAHEIGHNIGAPHDGDVGTDSSPDTTACPKLDGFLMSYDGWGTTDHWKLSKCSRDAIRGYLSKVQCVYQINGKQNITSIFQVGEMVSVHDNCKYLQENSTPIIGTPDQFCRNTICTNDTGRLFVLNNPPGNGAPCGKDGKCENGFCIGQSKREHLSLDGLCGKLTGQSNATWSEEGLQQFVWSNYQVLPVPVRCGSYVFCKYKVEHSYQFIQLSFPMAPDAGTECGDGKICNNGECVEDKNTDLFKCVKLTHQPSKTVKPVYQPSLQGCTGGIGCIFDERYIEFLVKPSYGTCGENKVCDNGFCTKIDPELFKCIKKTGKFWKDLTVVRQASQQNCKGGIQCVYKLSTSEYLVKPSEGKCGKHGSCFNGVCIEVNPNVQTTLRNVCQQTMKKKHGITLIPAKDNRDEYCSNLKCTNKAGDSFVSAMNTPDGVLCGPIRVCKAGKCVLCS